MCVGGQHLDLMPLAGLRLCQSTHCADHAAIRPGRGVIRRHVQDVNHLADQPFVSAGFACFAGALGVTSTGDSPLYVTNPGLPPLILRTFRRSVTSTSTWPSPREALK